MTTKKPLLCRVGVHRYARSDRDVHGTFRCRRCSKPGSDGYFDAAQTMPGGGSSI